MAQLHHSVHFGAGREPLDMKFSLQMPLGEVFPVGEFQSAEAAREIAGARERPRTSSLPRPAAAHTSTTSHGWIRR